MVTAIYPGSFDPVTYGHLDILKRASALFDKVIIAVGTNLRKHAMFSLQTRLDMLKEVTGGTENIDPYPNVEIKTFPGLLVDFAWEQKAGAIIRGLRALSDFEAEFQMALFNRHMEPGISTVFLMPHARYTYVSSSAIREIAQYSGLCGSKEKDLSEFVPPIVAERLKEYFKR